nr:MAG TPA: hypothetical protein [Inoviridae sp.]
MYKNRPATTASSAAVMKNASSGWANTAEKTPLISAQIPVRNTDTVIDTSKREKGYGAFPIPLVCGISRGQRAWPCGRWKSPESPDRRR